MAERVPREDVIALTVLQMGMVPAYFSAKLPSLWTTAHFANQDLAETTEWIRKGEWRASALSILTGVAVSVLAGSWLPLGGTLVMVAQHLYDSEDALNNGNGRGVM